MAVSPYMSLDLPVPGSTAGPAYASMLVAALTAVDAHDHSPGKGVPVRTSGLYVDSGLDFGGYDATSLRSARLTNHDAPLAGAADLGCLFVSGGELYFRDGSGNAIQFSASGALNTASLGAIGGDYSTSGASLAYASVSKLFSFESSAGVKAHAALGNLSITEAVASGKAVTLRAPTGLAANYQVTLPAALPAATKIVTLDNTGALAAAYDVDNVTLEVASSQLRVKPGAALSLGAVTATTLGVGAATFSAGPTITSGNLALTQAAAQSILKTGGQLILGTGDAQVVTLLQNNTGAVEINSTGLYLRTGSTIQNVSTPVNATDAATKGYVDGFLPLFPTLTITVRDTGTSWWANSVRGSTTGFSFARPSAGVYTVSHASIAADQTVAQVTAHAGVGVSAAIGLAPGVMTVRMSDTANHDFSLTIWI